MIHKELLKQPGLHEHARKSDWIRIKRNRLIRPIINAFQSMVEKTMHRQTYTCANSTTLPGTLLLDDNTTTCSNVPATDAHMYAGVTHAYFAALLNRDSIDDKGLTLISSVNYDVNYDNAFWNGSQMVYGDGDGSNFINFSDDLSVVAHELSHGVTQTTCGLWYFGQSGALNEAFSDISGITCRHWHENDADPKTANWLIGDKCVGPKFPGKSIRTFKPGPAYQRDPQPDDMSQLYRGFQDNGGVHINSKIHNRAFYELCLLLNEPSFGKPIQIVWAAHKALKSTANFKACAKAEVAAATSLYGADVASKVKQAWAVVGVNI